MNPQLHLLIATWGYFLCMLVVLGFGFFVFFQKPHKTIYTVWLGFCLSMALYQLSFIIGVNVPATSRFAYWIWYSNFFENILMSLFSLHIFILATDSMDKFKNLLKLMYGLAFILIPMVIIWPHAFLASVSPRAYFLSWSDSTGTFYNLVNIYFFLNFIASYIVLFYQRARSGVEGRKRIDYYLFGITFGLMTGIFAFSLDYSLPFDPAWSGLIGLFAIPLVYGMMKKGIMDIKLVFKRTLIVASFVAFVMFLFLIVSLFSSWLTIHSPGFGLWIMPLILSLILVPVGLFFYNKERDQEDLRYEFTTVVTHKFRTPLTRIRWQTEDLSGRELPEDAKAEIDQINSEAVELIRLSNLLISADNMEQKNYLRSFIKVDLDVLTKEVLSFFRKTIESKKIDLTINTEPNLPSIYVDKERISSVLHILIENALIYTKENGMVKIDIITEKETIRFSIEDNGIGIEKQEQPHVFDRFYRGSLARRANTEGVGLELYVAKSSVERQGGSMGFRSDGPGMGSTFWFTLPVENKEEK
ncbi:MAG: ATP-binding protein [bacterium]